MSIRVKGSDLKFNSQMIIERCISSNMRDTQGRPFKLITLSRTPYKPVAERTREKCGLAENTIIIRTNNNIYIQTPPEDPITGKRETMGNIEWIRDDFTKRMIAKIADTPNNRMMLAIRYYDNLEKIDDPFIEMEIKKMADKIDEDNKKISYTWEKTTRTTDPKTGVSNCITVPVTGTMYDYQKMRRENQFNKSYDNSIINPAKQKIDIDNRVDVYQSEIEKLKAKILELENNNNLNSEIVSTPVENVDHNEEEIDLKANWETIKNLKLPKLKRIMVKLGVNNTEMIRATREKALKTIADIIGIEYDIKTEETGWSKEKLCQPQATT